MFSSSIGSAWFELSGSSFLVTFDTVSFSTLMKLEQKQVSYVYLNFAYL